MDLQCRKNNRLSKFDYNQNGYYFITICTKDRKKILCDIVGGGALDTPEIHLTRIGEIVERYILSTNNINNMNVDKYVIMPDHIHMILCIKNNGTPRASSPTNCSIPSAISGFKRLVNKEVGFKIFQRSFYDHIIRNLNDYSEIYQYIENNPINYIQKYKK